MKQQSQQSQQQQQQMSIYSEYENYIYSIVATDDTFQESDFKSNPKYTNILEHVNKQTGIEYLKKIEEEYPQITFEDMKEFININDKYGSPEKTIFTTSNSKLIYCSPSCMRYIYHSLKILEHLANCQMADKRRKKNDSTLPPAAVNPTSIIELGGGYGGLYLAINTFAPKMGVVIDKYYIIDLPIVTVLIKKYLFLHKDVLSIPLEIFDNSTYQEHLNVKNAFLVSNYYFTEINENERNKYTETIIKNNVMNGFITWQTCFGLDIGMAKTILNKNPMFMEEQPQTADSNKKNYHVFF